ncbi:MAG TPA: SDR family NAD(P)-dependent oxidoreductase [Candidatus Acidoferrales bacterium]|nr:SDR family NAD(P)-dependent oxidoreductase [Candidatus Acidoferrales bacterium]
MNLELHGKTAVVSGSTAGIGLAIATALAEEGAAVVVNGRTAARVAAAEEGIRRKVKGAQLRGVAADLGTAGGAVELARQAPEADILVNNLGIYAAKPFAEITDAEWMHIFEVNVMSGVRLTRHYLPGMLRQNWGRVIFISSESGQHIPPEMVHYGMTKTAQIAVARGIAEGVAGTGVTVNSVLAGPTASEGVANFVADMAKQRSLTPAQVEKDFFTTVRPSSLLKRFETPEEVAAVVAFVASPRSTAINGAAVRAEGGVVQSIF